jgi:DNA-binding protein Fis
LKILLKKFDAAFKIFKRETAIVAFDEAGAVLKSKSRRHARPATTAKPARLVIKINTCSGSLFRASRTKFQGDAIMDGQVNFENRQTNDNSTAGLEESRIKALKSLAQLLLREVEQIEQTNLINGKCLLSEQVSLVDDVQNYEAQLIRSALLQSKGHQRRAAKILGIKNTTLNAKIKRYGIESHIEMAKI